MNKNTESFQNKRTPFQRRLRKVLAWVLIVPGLFLFVTPIPVGIFMVTAGFLLLHSASPRFRQRVLNLASRFPKAAQKMKIERILNHMKSEDTRVSSRKDLGS
ncbi:conserved hypothetical protein [delta proteobacterium NaphS2]|nr:conserved hypothetical protein [delta proteobacterium NaphS2]